jgi:hypothetical protein
MNLSSLLLSFTLLQTAAAVPQVLDSVALKTLSTARPDVPPPPLVRETNDRPTLSAHDLPSGIGTMLRKGVGPLWDEGIEGELWVRGTTYKARVDADGLLYVPFLGSRAERSWPLKLSCASLTLGGADVPLSAAAPVRRGSDEIVLERGVLREVLRFERDGVEQSFELDVLPERADLRLEIAVESDLAAAVHGSGLRFDGPAGGVDYGAWTVLDAAGERLELPSRMADGRVVLELDAGFVERAVLPLRLDPFVSTFPVSVGPVECSEVKACFVSPADVRVMVWTEDFSAADADINSVHVTSFGTVYAQNYVDLTTADYRGPSIGANSYTNTFLVAATKDSVEVWGRIVPGNTMALGAPTAIATAADGFPKSDPSVGGDYSISFVGQFLCAYVTRFSTTDHDIHARMVATSGGPNGPVILIDGSDDTLDEQPRVSASNGHMPFATQRWNVTWARVAPGASVATDIHAAQLLWSGQIMTPSFNLTQTPDTFETLWSGARGVSSLLDDNTGSEREWAVSYVVESGGNREATLALLLEDQVRDVTTLAALNGQSGVQTYAYDLDSDGATLVLASVHDEVALHTLRTTGGVLSLAEGPVMLDSTPEAAHHVAIALSHNIAFTEPTVLVAAQEGPSAAQGDIFGAFFEIKVSPIGNVPCNSKPNSTGTMAWLSATGSEIVADNDLTLEVEHLPAFKNGIFILAPTGASMPFGQGVLCLGSPITRIPQGFNSGPNGVVAADLDLTDLGGVAVQSGQTWHFQFWFRDSGQVNLSNSVAITFE